jgi:hypothetical protein
MLDTRLTAMDYSHANRTAANSGTGTLMKHSVFATLLLTLLMVSASLRADDLPADKSQFHLFLLVGQSNMAGRGKVADADRKPLPRVFMLTKSGEWKPAVAPLHFDKGSAGVGIGREFAKQISKTDPSIAIGLIPCAAGGSPISTWEPGGYHGQTKSHPYDDTIRRAKLAMKSGVLKGILWHQGESDAKPKLADVYEKKLHAFIVRLRGELQAKSVPFIAGQMGQFKERPWSDDKKRVDQAHRDVSTNVKHAAFVTSDGLSHKGDEVHFDSESYRELGRRYATAFQKLAGKKR